MRITSVGQGAQLTVVERPNGPRFERWKAFSRAAVEASVAKSPPTLADRLPTENNASATPSIMEAAE